jgi:hypothetical protein
MSDWYINVLVFCRLLGWYIVLTPRMMNERIWCIGVTIKASSKPMYPYKKFCPSNVLSTVNSIRTALAANLGDRNEQPSTNYLYGTLYVTV